MIELHALAFEHDGVELVGQMAVPEQPGPHPAVMVMHTALGLGEMMRERVRRLAQLGYVAVVSEACHAFTDPNAGAMGLDGIAYDPIADRVSWAGTIALLEATISRRANSPGP
jgi:dienelactone hydrolase